MHTHYTFLALDIARQRAAEADAARLAGLRRSRAAQTSGLRRAIARVALAIARAADRDLEVSFSPR